MFNINSIIVILIFIASLILAIMSYPAVISYDADGDKRIPHNNAPWQWKFFEVWNIFINFLLGGLIGYYFILVRWAPISKGESLNIADFALFFIFAMCIFRWFPYLIRNFTVGIEQILKRILDK